MKKVKVLLKEVEGLQIPVYKKLGDAAPDVFATGNPEIKGELITITGKLLDEKIYASVDYIQYPTNLYCEPLSDGDSIWHLECFARSSIREVWLSICNAIPTIDNSYRNQIFICFRYLWQPSDLVQIQLYGKPSEGEEDQYYSRWGFKINNNKIYKKGERICQLKPREDIGLEFEVVKELSETVRGLQGFGSSGR
jgi:dUTPase